MSNVSTKVVSTVAQHDTKIHTWVKYIKMQRMQKERKNANEKTNSCVYEIEFHCFMC